MAYRSCLLLLCCGWLGSSLQAEVKPHPLFTDNMVLQADQPCHVWGVANAGEEVQVMLSGGKEAAEAKTQADDKGFWSVQLPKQSYGTGYTLKLVGSNTVEFKNVAVGEVWVCSGQSNMEWSLNASYDADRAKAKADNPMLRLFTVKKRTAPKPIDDQADLGHFTTWAECTAQNVGSFSAVAYYFGQAVQAELKAPVGLIHTSWGGTPAQAWTSYEALAAVEELKDYTTAHAKATEQFAADKKPWGPNVPGSLYNAMIHPLLKFPIRGAIWYQGESNAGRAEEYRTLFPTMIQDWRTKWGGEDFPFYAVQLAPFIAGDADGVAYAELRDAQLHATKALKNVGMAVITDVGDLFDIHPRNKQVVGNRLARAALANTYKTTSVGSGPIYKSLEIKDNEAIVSFDHLGGGLVGRFGPNSFNVNGAISGFTLCGEDDSFYPAKAKIVNNTVVVTCDKVAKPKAVRFGRCNYPVVNLFNKEGLPASPFRTDSLPLTTAKMK